MAKWYGKIGYSITEEIRPGVWDNTITERSAYGEVRRFSGNTGTNQESTNDNVNISNQISIIADPFATQNIHAMKYIEFMGAKWKISNVEVQYPRLLLTVGGVYNG